MTGATGTIAAPASAAAAAHRPAQAVGNITTHIRGVKARGELDCNGFSPVQKPMRPFECTDIRGFANQPNQNTWGGRFYDNGHYIGHDEPDTTFISNRPGSGGNVSWNLTLGTDPAALPTATSPGKDVSHWFELTPAPWLSMAICDPNSYPQLPCRPNSNANAPSGAYPGGGSAFMEMQFYPPGNAPFYDNESCSNTKWCAALTIDSLECTDGFAQCNTNCEEPVNFAFVQRNGVPLGSPAPNSSDQSTYVPNGETLLMNPADKLSVHIWDAPVPGKKGQKALEVVIHDHTTGQTGFIQASAKNGFANTSILNCATTPFNFQPEYSSASVGNYIPWAALQTNISTEFETGHFEPCTSLAQPFATNPFDSSDTSTAYNQCNGPYETAGAAEGPGTPEYGDAICYAAGSTHNGYAGPGTSAPPNLLTGCQDNLYQNGDLDYDGSAYWREWPTSTTAGTYPGSFVESMPTTTRHAYPELFFQTDAALSESSCNGFTGAGCTVPPPGPGHFYPYWSEAKSGHTCTLEFGNVSRGVYTFGKDAQYGVPQSGTLGYPEFIGKLLDNTCAASPSEGYAVVGRKGAVVGAGDTPAFRAVHAPSAPVVAIVATPDGHGYYAVTSTGVVSTAGDATFQGDLTTLRNPVRVSDIVAIVLAPNGRGYWLIGARGGVYAFGGARFKGSLPGRGIHVNDVVAGLPAAAGNGYLLVSRTGGVFAFGSAHSHGSLPERRERVDDITGAAATVSGAGYVLVGANGSVFVFGSGTRFEGSLPSRHVHVSDVVGLALTSSGGGYWIATSAGRVYHFGDARLLASKTTASAVPLTGITTVYTASPIP